MTLAHAKTNLARSAARPSHKNITVLDSRSRKSISKKSLTIATTVGWIGPQQAAKFDHASQRNVRSALPAA